MPYELGIIGAGNMAEAIARGVLAAGVFAKHQMIAADVSPARRELFEKQLGVRAVDSNAEVARDCRVLLLSVKPYQMKDVLEGIAAVLGLESLVISIAAGVSTVKIQNLLGGGTRWRVVRAMPNTPMLLGEGMVAIAPGAFATADDLSLARRIFESAATVIQLGEEKMDAVTAMSGSGPAYFFYFVEAMIEAGIAIGLSADEAAMLAKRTAAGAAKMLNGTPDSPEELRKKVTTPGGTTHAAISTMEERHVADAIVAAIARAARRSREMGA